ncbi:Transient receptor potential cation channel subfamily A member 1 [Trichoplax sp. H2]|nr:Transient receptor potential cation channel subfamily A member 1 [Trichoplax sp. H2]|eukprot:RDD43947.1 Transient receptor potential cation channel subfamily A member 1 [Trichoplax sp. H2]
MLERRNFRKNSLTLFPRSFPVRPTPPNDKINEEYENSEIPNARSTTNLNLDLFWAAKFGDVSVIQEYFVYNKDKNACNRLDEHKLSPLHYAAKYNRVEIIRSLVDHGADVNIPGYDSIPPISIAAKHNSLAAFEVLISCGAKVDLQDVDGNTTLHEASKFGHVRMCELILRIDPALVNYTDNDLMTPLHVSCMRDRNNVCKLLIKHGASLIKKSIDGGAPIHFAASRGATEVIGLLLDSANNKRRKYIDQINDRDNERRTPLHRAAQGGYKQAVEMCVRNGADITAIQRDGLTALHIAASNGYPDVVEALIQHHAPVDARDFQYRTPLHLAASFGHTAVMIILMQSGADINSTDSRRRTPLLFAVEKGHLEAAKFLLQYHAKVDIYDDQNKSCLHMAAECCHHEVLTFLLNEGGKIFINEVDTYDRTPLHYAAEEGFYNIAEILIENGAQLELNDGDDNTPLHLACRGAVNTQTVELLCKVSPSLLNSLGERSRTPLHIAVSYGHSTVVKTLLENGAETEKRDGSYLTPLEIAASKGHQEILECLLNSRASVNSINFHGETALHIAAATGHANSIKLLLDHGAEVSFVNNEDRTCLDIAIENMRKDAAMVIVTHKQGKRDLIMRRVDEQGRTVMQNLIRKLPEVAETVMSSCIQHDIVEDPKSTNKHVSYDFTLLDPGPSFELEHRKDGIYLNNNALQTMIHYKRTNLLKHELTKKLLDVKWNRIGSYVFYLNLVLYLLFVFGLTSYILNIQPPPELRYQNGKFIGLINPLDVNRSSQNVTDYELDKQRSNGYRILVIILASVNLTKEVYQMMRQRLRYFASLGSYFELLLYGSAIFFMSTMNHANDYVQWTVGSITIFLAYFALVMQFQRMEIFGIYVLMLKSMLITILKVVLVVFSLIQGFALSFYMLAPNESVLFNVPIAWIKVLDMMIGEIDYRSVFIDGIESGRIKYPHGIMVLIMLVVFMFLMPILVMNLMIGLAIGDIDRVQKEASLKRLTIQVEFLDDLERSFPYRFRKYCHVENAIHHQNRFWAVLETMLHEGVTTEKHKAESFEKQSEQLRDIQEELSNHKQQLKRIGQLLDSLLKSSSKGSNQSYLKSPSITYNKQRLAGNH